RLASCNAHRSMPHGNVRHQPEMRGTLVDHIRRLAGHPCEPLGAAGRRTPADPAPTRAGGPRAQHQPLEGIRTHPPRRAALDQVRWLATNFGNGDPCLRGAARRRGGSRMRGKRANGEGSIYQRKDGRWTAAYYVPLPTGGRSRRYVYGATPEEA